jgi:Secretion system C-terminal sorting domain
MDITGKTIIRKMTDNPELDISSLSDGVYLLQVKYNGKTGSAKVVKY